MVRKVCTVLMGLGNVNLGLLKILIDKKSDIAKKFNLEFKIVGIADSTGIAVRSKGFGYQELLNLKFNKGKVNEMAGFLPQSADKITECVEADLLIEASPVNLQTGEPGLQATKGALGLGWKVVLANKAPLVLAYDQLIKLTHDHKTKLAFSATVCGGLPVINVLQRDLKFAKLKSLWGIFNATSNFVLQELEKGGTMEEAIKKAQLIGAAETDPSLDLSGQDTANKLYIIMRSFSDFNGTINDIQLKGINEVSQADIRNAAEKNTSIKLVASAHKKNDKWELAVVPTVISKDSFMGSCNGWEMGIEIKTDLYESISLKNYEADPTGTAAAVLRDAINVIED